MTKEEFYKSSIELHKKCGQGVSGIVKLGNEPRIARYLDELIEEGLMKACDTGGSLGHRESNIFYMPTKGYNVWEDDDGGRYKGKYLTFVRLYLGCLDDEPEEGLDKKDIKRFINPTAMDLLRDSDTMKLYSEWLERNEAELEEMINLDDFYKSPKVEFTEDEISWIKSKDWYKENKTIAQCFKELESRKEKDLEIISINKQLIGLYNKSGGYKSELEKAVDDISNTENDILKRKKVHNWFDSLDKETKIQEVI